MCNYLHEEVLRLLAQQETSYAKPMNSQEIGEILKVTPSYIRSQLSQLVKVRLVRVRRGNGGGYYVMQEERQQDGSNERK
ncbi:Rrf2 family transcriptional regulator [Pelosinus sp. UFO1]|uniref:Rrf2 family transcriptional regulator n=1 Tax=Pelosinus sp. UFO1 TaxID=484770 RepID=UPI0004D0E861|nr:Rrf2 family transcriptional regulator [Pelosinus sp. UFO1]AIF53652.1 transcriptional regulator, BadM/Rrf2 family [Pelosinus sp. UFO1]